MPSGSKKRKALKKPRPGEPASSPQGGDVAALEPEFLPEDFIAKETRGTDEGSGAATEAGILDSAEPIGETSQRAKQEELYTPTPDHPKTHAGDPQEQTELQAPPFTAAEGVMVHTGCKMDGEAPADSPERDPSQFIVNSSDITHDKITPVNYFPHGEIQSGLEHDADIADAPPIDSEQAPDERRSKAFKCPCKNEFKQDESSAMKVPTADLTSEGTRPSIDANNHRETFPDSGTVSGKIEQGVEVNTELPDTHSMGVGLGAEEKKFEPQGALTSNEPNFDSSPVKEKMTRKNMGQNTGDITPKSEALAAETKLDIGQDVSPTNFEPGSGQSVFLSSLKGLSGNEPKFDESSMTEEARGGMIQENMGPNIETASSHDTSSDSGALYGGIQPEVEAHRESSDSSPIDIINERNELKPAESSVEEEFVTGMAQQVTGPGNVAYGLDSGVDQMRDENLAATRSVLDATLEDGQPENMEPTNAQEREICIASAKFEPEAGPEMDVTALDMERGAVREDSQLEIDKAPASGEMDTILASIESQAIDNADAETLVISDKNSSGSQSIMCQDTDPRNLGTDAFKADAGEIEPEKNYAEADTVNTSDTEEPVIPRTESGIDAYGGEIEANTEVPSNDVEVEQVSIAREGESELDASLGDFKCIIDPRVEEAEAETKPEENTLLVDAQEDIVAEVFTEPELQERESQKAALDMTLQNIQSSLEAGAESGPDRLQDTSHDVNTGIGLKSEEMKGGKVDAGSKGSCEMSDISCLKDDINERAENSDDIGMNPNEVITKHFERADGTDLVNKDLSEPFDVNGSNDRVDISISDFEPQGKMPHTGLEASTEVPVLGSGVEVPLDMELSQEGSYETALGQQDGQDQQGDTAALAEETHAAEIKGFQTTSDEQELSKDPRTCGVQTEKVEEGVSTISLPKSELVKDEYEPNHWIAFEQERRLNSPSGIVGKDIEEEQAALSTVAEAGSSITDLDEMPYYQQFSTDFTNSEHDGDTFESRESAKTLAFDSSPPRSPFLNETGPTEQKANDERSDGCGHDLKKDCLKKEFEWKAAQDLEPTAAQEKVAPTSRVTREVPAEVHVKEEGNAPERGSNMEAGGKGEQRAVPANLGDISKGNFDTVELELSNSKAIHADEEVPSKISNGGPVQVGSGQGMNGREAFHKQEASLPMEAHVHEVKQRALNEGNLEAKKEPTREGTVQHSNNLGCCGMFNLLLGKS